jgi:putative protease
LEIIEKENVVPKILAPIHSYEGAVKVIRAGAEELYCGVTLPTLKNFVLYRGSACNVTSYHELDQIIKFAHNHGVTVYLTVNVPHITSTVQNEYKKHLNRCLEAGIDALIIGNLGILYMIKKMKVQIPFFASTFLTAMNYEAVSFLKNVGFSRVILERQLSLKEISNIAQQSSIDLEVFIHGGGCSNINANCFLLHQTDPDLLRALSPIEGVNPPCRLPFEIFHTNDTEKKVGEGAVLDAYTFCSLCRLPELMKTGVSGFKIVGRCLNEEYQETTTQLYHHCMNLIKMGKIEQFHEKVNTLKKKFNPLPPAISNLDEMFCEQKRCYYTNLFHAPYKIPVSWKAWVKYRFKKIHLED